MYRPLLRSAPLRSLPHGSIIRSLRHVTTAPPAQRTRSWKNRAVRLALAAGAVYFYNTSSLFAEEPSSLMHDAPVSNLDDEPLPLLASLKPTPSDKRPIYTPLAASTPSASTASSAEATSSPQNLSDEAKTLLSDAPSPEIDDASSSSSSSATSNNTTTSAAALEADASQQGAFNEETGEINWDCPCLGGMAYGPCGPEFRAAFGCFVHSAAEPKGMDCIDKFQGMQTCFREHPDVYAAELGEDEDAEADEDEAATAATTTTAREVDGVSGTAGGDAANGETDAQLRIGWERAPGEETKRKTSMPARSVSQEPFAEAEPEKTATAAPSADPSAAASHPPSSRSGTTAATEQAAEDDLDSKAAHPART